jgi:hypothetical protein
MLAELEQHTVAQNHVGQPGPDVLPMYHVIDHDTGWCHTAEDADFYRRRFGHMTARARPTAFATGAFVYRRIRLRRRVC